MSLFRKNHMRCDYAENASAPFPVRQIPASDLRAGMTIVATPEGCTPSTVCCGHWPHVEDDSVVQEWNGEPHAYWVTDEPGECGGPRSATHRAPAGALITIAA